MATNYTLKAGWTLTATAGAVSGSAHQVEDGTVGTVLPPFHARTFGPYLVERNFSVSDGVTVTTAEASEAVAFGGLFMANAGAPVDAAQATLLVNPAGDDNALTFTARAYGVGGNGIRIAYVDPGAADAALAVSVTSLLISVSLATDGAEAISSTAADVKAAIEADPSANALVSVSIYTADSGSADDGTGVVTAMALTALADGAGTGIGQARPGCLCIDTTNGATYINNGTQAAPDWTASVALADYAATASTVNALAALHLYGAGAPVDYTDGTPPATGEGTAPKGAIYSDTTNGFVYRNSGTQAEPIWTKLGDAA